MKKQILVFAAIFLAVFFTSCEQEALITPVESSIHVEQSASPPQQALDNLEQLIHNDFIDRNSELRCSSQHFGAISKDNNLVLAAVLCGVRLKFYGGRTSTAAPPAWFYYHVDERNTNGQYKRIDSGMKYGTSVNWSYKTYSNQFYNSGCKWRAYVYVWDVSCGIWKRLAVNYY